ncbi:MAG: hypothetical protein AAFY15_11320, partial [Cyanobacteria bacterium J06648_11]
MNQLWSVWVAGAIAVVLSCGLNPASASPLQAVETETLSHDLGVDRPCDPNAPQLIHECFPTAASIRCRSMLSLGLRAR